MNKNRLFIFLAILIVISLIYFICFSKQFTSSDVDIIPVSAGPDPYNDQFSRCLRDGQRALDNMSLPWFITFGTALMYYRSNNFVSDDIDVGIFIDDLHQTNTSDTDLVSKIRQYGFNLLFKYGSMKHGQQWTFQCPHSELHFDIFVFYPADLANNETFAWWTASYNGRCNTMRYHKCRWWFSKFKLDTFQRYEQQFHIVPKVFLTEQYGPQWMIPKKYHYTESLHFLPNLIDEH